MERTINHHESITYQDVDIVQVDFLQQEIFKTYTKNLSFKNSINRNFNSTKLLLSRPPNYKLPILDELYLLRNCKSPGRKMLYSRFQ